MNKIKTIFIILVFLSALNPFFVFAQTFSDVSTDAWYFDYVQELADDGVIDAGDTFRPNDALNRAELTKIVITAIDGLSSYEAPATPTFDDVATGAWYYDYIEAAASLGIINGYTDEGGNLTGMFGPGDTVNRAAATKILVNAFSVPIDLTPASSFPDVTSGAWYYDYVVTAYNQSILDGYSNGYFGPADPVTRAQVAKITYLAMNRDTYEYKTDPADETEDETDEETGEEEEAEQDEDNETDEEESGTPFETNNSGISSDILSNDSNEIFVSRYIFTSLYEDVNVSTLTIVNDLTSNNLGDDPVGTSAVKNIIIRYPDKNGFLRTSETDLDADGTARFTNLEMFTERYEETPLEVYADISKVSDVGESLSGEIIRIGLQNKDNDSNSFKATGDASGESISIYSLGSFSNPPEEFVIRKTVPDLQVTSDDSILVSGENELIEFQISATDSGSLSLGRIVLDVSVSDSSGGDLALSNFKLLRGNTLLDDEVNIYDTTGASDLSPAGGGNLMNGNSKIIISFNEEETVSAGKSRTYRLKVTVNNADNDDYVITNIARGDENTPLSGLTANTNDNTGRIYKNGDSSNGIFTGPDDFSRTAGSYRNIIWSDKSASVHSYPEVLSGTVTDGTGSYDWTNGYLLDIYSLSETMLSR